MANTDQTGKQDPNRAITLPDVLGYFSNNERANMAKIDVAVGMRPRVARSGKKFDVLVLLQNTVDIRLDVLMMIHLPQTDAQGNADCFTTPSQRLSLTLDGLEVTLVSIPIYLMAKTAPGSDYKVEIELKVRPMDADARIRLSRKETNREDFNPALMSESMQAFIEDLQTVNFTAETAGRGRIVECPFRVLTGSDENIKQTETAQVTKVWAREDVLGDADLLRIYAGVWHETILPELHYARTFPMIEKATHEYFKDVGYELHSLELLMITKALSRVIDHAIQVPNIFMKEFVAPYHVAEFIQHKKWEDPLLVLPAWVKRFNFYLHRNIKLSERPVPAIMHFAYQELLYDVIMYGFSRLQATFQVPLGDIILQDEYATRVIKQYANKQADFKSLYMPLILTGMLVTGEIPLAHESTRDQAFDLRDLLNSRRDEMGTQSKEIFAMGYKLVDLLIEG